MGTDPTRTTTRDIRRQNRSALLSKLFFDGPRSRLELSQLTGLSSATVSTVTAELIEDRLVVEAGQVESNGGRPRVLLRVDPAYGYVIGVDVGETGVTVELFDLAMKRIATVVRPLKSARPTPDAVVAEVVAGIDAVLDGAGAPLNGEDSVDTLAESNVRSSHNSVSPVPPIDPGRVIGIGIGVPGIVEHGGADQGGIVLVHAPTIDWHDVPLAAMLADHGVAPAIFIGNGAKTQAQAEMWFGAARGARHAVVALVGSGVGAAVITDGATFQGASSSAGEWGHTMISYGGRLCRCGDRGCLEAYVGAESILERYVAAGGSLATSEADESVEIDALIAAARSGKADSIARAVIADTVGYLGAGIGNLVNMFNPERVVLGGWAGLALGAAFLPEIRAAAQEHALAHPYGQVTIELSQLGADAVALGAATLPLAELLARGEDTRTR
jgi:predicted NBD/HSP70 family sugar kinase